ncbi:uncharacterized protein LOC127866806 isoform X2 [Dreissena polymorpha]|uniref:uncharacterized protein LOC127844713 isoform X2 n=1 Tax=Dreissena polymorpha TaxID=45954 RepID=UPI0022651DED|nr:uncharacterized protein LOC127844713 isoform X2 [Dreissena polymorpha]XP_052263597.1 uncharacterized protein LOC127866806 isoform X2 [Dreissena polymorpha]
MRYLHLTRLGIIIGLCATFIVFLPSCVNGGHLSWSKVLVRRSVPKDTDNEDDPISQIPQISSYVQPASKFSLTSVLKPSGSPHKTSKDNKDAKISLSHTSEAKLSLSNAPGAQASLTHTSETNHSIQVSSGGNASVTTSVSSNISISDAPRGASKFSLTNVPKARTENNSTVKAQAGSSSKSSGNCQTCVHTQIQLQLNPAQIQPVISPEPIFKCPEESVEINCLSCKWRVYRQCPVHNAVLITEIHILEEFHASNGNCTVGDHDHDNFGVLGPSDIWVNHGCRARFLVCYHKAENDPKTMNCMSTTSKHMCPFRLPKIHTITKVTILWSYGSQRCTELTTWGYTDKNLWVDKGCSATFRVFYTLGSSETP